jgi:hypothetical protein
LASGEFNPPLEGSVEYPGWGPYLDEFARILKDELMRAGLAPIDTIGPGNITGS